MGGGSKNAPRTGRGSSSAQQLTLFDRFDAIARRVSTADAESPARGLFFTVLALLGLGLLLQISHLSSTVPHSMFAPQVWELCLFRVAGLGVILLAARLGPSRLEPWVPLLMGATILALLAVWVPGIGMPINGANRWLRYPVQWQPSELARMVAVLWAARRCVQLGRDIQDARRGAFPLLAFGLFLFALIVVEPDLGGAILLLMSFCTTLWVGGARSIHVGGGLVLITVPALLLGATFMGYVRDRLSIFFGDSTNAQVNGAFNAMADGGWVGTGLTQGPARTSGLQYQQSDYMFSLVGEEFGLFGMLVVVGLFGAMLVYTIRLVSSVKNRFSSLAAFGLLMTVIFQAMLHMQVVTGLAPPKGMILPFLSDGNTALMSSCLAVGLALGAARESWR